MSTVWFVREGNRGVAYFRANDEAEDVFIAAIALDVYDSETEAQDRFAALVHVAADFFRRKYAAEAIAPASRLDGYPCATCETSAGQDLRSHVGQLSSAGEIPLSPGGLPLGCCKITVVGGFRGQSDAPRPAARR